MPNPEPLGHPGLHTSQFSRSRRRTSGKKGNRRPLVIVFVIIVLLAGIGTYLFGPGFLPASWGTSTVLVIGNRILGEDMVKVEAGEIYINVHPLQNYIDPNFFWDENEKTAIITTADRVIHMRSEKLATEINLEPVELEFPLREEDGQLYLPLLFLADFYEISVKYHRDTDTVVVDKNNDTAYSGKIIPGSVRLREGADLREKTLEILKAGDTVRLKEVSSEEWVVARSEQGLVGYLPNSSIRITGEQKPLEEPAGGSIDMPYDTDPQPVPDSIAETDSSKTALPNPFVLTWEFAYNPPNTAEIGDMPSLSVVSPTWFHLQDGEGNIRNLADPAYVRWAHNRGYHVWGLVSNNFDQDITAEMLTSSTRRRNFILKLLALASLYNLDGLNIDFENFHSRYKDHFTQFIRELAPLCREEGLVLSIDVTMISMSEYWSLCYDRRPLAEAADYIALMAYDEHWGASPVAGSVSSLPWVERGLKRVLEEVPADKLLLGVPFYSRIWEIDHLPEGGEEVSSKAYSMEKIEEILKQKNVVTEWCEKTQQNFAAYEEDGKTFKVWLEDQDSMKQRVELVNKYGLAGVAAWRRGFEKEEIWQVINETLEVNRND